MINKLIKAAFFCAVLLPFAGCKTGTNSNQVELLKQGVHTIVVKEVKQASEYTYVRFQEEGNPEVMGDTSWAAIIKSDIKPGDTYYFKGGFPMANFPSKELKHTFRAILFIDSLSKNPDLILKRNTSDNPHGNVGQAKDPMKAAKSMTIKSEINISPVPGGVTIADLFGKKSTFSGKTVKVKGQVTKFNPEIMGKNWVHLQDGTEADGKFDLTITTNSTVAVGDIVIFEGKITLDKDLGYDYFYEVLMEDAKIIK